MLEFDIKNIIKSKSPIWIKRFILKNVFNIPDPYTRYDDMYKCIFIHIPKAAGISISFALFDDNIGHRKIKYFKIYNKKKFDRYFKFTFVRNPWSRLLSAFMFLKQGGRNITDKEWAQKNLCKFNNFYDFVISLKEDKQARKILNWQHFTPQYKYICDDNLNINVDYIGRLENIEEDFEYVKCRLNINAELTHKNKSGHKHYTDYYNKETKAIIKNLYQRDIKLLNYKFGDG